MVAEQKIEEAAYFLEKIKQAATRRDFVPNLSAFMSAMRSIPDYLLEDYNMKLGLNIPLSETLYPKDFRREAKNQSNQIAKKFIDRYDTELRKLYNDAVGGLLMSKRNIEIHRTDVPVQAKFSRVLSETIGITDSVSIEVRDKNGNLKTRSEQTRPETKSVSQNSQAPENKPIPQPADSVEWFFTDFKNDNVISVCNKFLDLMKLFVIDIRKDYP